MSSNALGSVRRKRRKSGTGETPYNVSRRKKNAEPSSIDFLSNFSLTTIQKEFTKEVVGKTWQLHHVSPLWRLSTSDSSIRTYEEQVSTLLSEDTGGIKAHLFQLKRIGLNGSDGLKITATKTTGDKATTVLEAFLCEPGRRTGVQSGFTSLPVLLCRGPQRLVSRLLDWLQAVFGCHVSPHHLPELDLCLLAGEFASSENCGRGLGGMELVYSTPSEVAKQGLFSVSVTVSHDPHLLCAGLSSVSVSVSHDSVASVWEKAGSTPEERRMGFVDLLISHVRTQLGFKLQEMSLQRVSTPVLHAEVSGRLKFMAEISIIPVLSALQSRCF